MSLAIYHCIAVDGPCLSSRPCGAVGIALVGDTFYKVAVGRIVDGYMEACAVGAEMVVHRCLGMLHSHVVEAMVATILRCPEKDFEIDHVVHDSIVAAEHFYIARP